jgi:putative molybdopterin biosynthesis protein
VTNRTRPDNTADLLRARGEILDPAAAHEPADSSARLGSCALGRKFWGLLMPEYLCHNPVPMSTIRDNHNRLRLARMQSGMSQAELARDAEVSRQALSALEAGRYQPSVQIAIRLARTLGESVESLFGDSGSHTIKASLAPGDLPTGIGTRVTLGRVGGRLVAVPQEAASLSLMPAGGLITEARRSGQVEIFSLRSGKEIGATLLIAGCDPSIPIVADWFARKAKHITLVSSLQTSYGAIDCVIRGQTHACGVHLCDRRTGEFNLGLIKRRLANSTARIVNFAQWEVGLAVRPNDRLGIRSVADLGNKGVRIVNRPPGSGARIVLDEMLKECGVVGEKILGYETEARGHLEVAAAVAAGSTDAGITLRVASEAFGLRFFAMHTEQYGLIIPEREFDSEPVKILLDALNSSALATEVGSLCFYDTRAMGQALALVN